MRGNPAARRGPGPSTSGGTEGVVGALGEGRVTGSLLACAGKSSYSVGPIIGTLGSHHYRNAPDDAIVTDTLRASGAGRAPDHGHIAVVPIQAAQCTNGAQGGVGIGHHGDPMFTATTRGDHAIAFHATQDPISGARAPCLGTEPGSIGVISFDEQQITHPENRSRPRAGDPAPTLAKQSRVDILGDLRPRRLTPREWERLQGFPDDYTLIDGAEDSPRYEALGNSMAVPVMRWIGKRLVAVERILRGVA